MVLYVSLIGTWWFISTIVYSYVLHIVRSLIYGREEAMKRYLLFLVILFCSSLVQAENPPCFQFDFTSLIDNGGDLTGTAILSGDSGASSWLNRIITSNQPVLIDQVMISMIKRVSPSVSILSIEYTGFTQGGTGKCKIHYRANRYAAITDTTIDFPLPSVRFLFPPGASIATDFIPEGDLGISWPTVFILEIKEDLTLPKYYYHQGDRLTRDLETETFTYRSKLTSSTNMILATSPGTGSSDSNRPSRGKEYLYTQHLSLTCSEKGLSLQENLVQIATAVDYSGYSIFLGRR